MASEELLPSALSSRFHAERELGRGGFGVVVLARDRELDRPVAIKLLTDRSLDEETRARFEREARLTAELKHPHVIGVYEHGLADGAPYIVYEFVDGVDLSRHVAIHGPPDGETAKRWAREIADALLAVHRAGLVHRDVKPENVLLREDGSAVLCDFGIARPEEGAKLTATGMILGTPAFMAPELWSDAAPSPAADQFAWAASLVQLITGEAVYGSGEPGEIMQRVGRGGALALPELLKRERPRLASALSRALAWEPGGRFPDMAGFAEALSVPVAVRQSAPTVRIEFAPPERPESPESEAPPRRIGPWMVGILILSITAVLMLRSGGGAAAPVELVQDDAEFRAAAREMDRVRRHLLALLDPDGADPLLETIANSDQNRSLEEALLGDEAFDLWSAYVQRLRAYVQACPAGRSGELVDDVRRMAHLLNGYEILEERLGRTEFRIQGSASRLAWVQKILESMRADAHDLLEVSGALPGSLPAPLELQRLLLAVLSRRTGAGGVIERLLPRIEESRDRAFRREYLRHVIYWTASLRFPEQLDCRETEAYLRRYHGELRGLSKEVPTPVLGSSVIYLMILQSKLVKACPAIIDALRAARLESTLLEVIDALDMENAGAARILVGMAEEVIEGTRGRADERTRVALRNRFLERLMPRLQGDVAAGKEALHRFLSGGPTVQPLYSLLRPPTLELIQDRFLSPDLLPHLRTLFRAVRLWLQLAWRLDQLPDREGPSKRLAADFEEVSRLLIDLQQAAKKLQDTMDTGKTFSRNSAEQLAERVRRLPEVRRAIDREFAVFTATLGGLSAQGALAVGLLRAKLDVALGKPGVDVRLRDLARKVESAQPVGRYGEELRRQLVRMVRTRSGRDGTRCDTLHDVLAALMPGTGSPLLDPAGRALERLRFLRSQARLMEACPEVVALVEVPTEVARIEALVTEAADGDSTYLLRKRSLLRTLDDGRHGTAPAIRPTHPIEAARLIKLGRKYGAGGD